MPRVAAREPRLEALEAELQALKRQQEFQPLQLPGSIVEILALLALPVAAPLASPSLAATAAPLPQITLAGPPALVSAPLMHMVQSNALQGVAQLTHVAGPVVAHQAGQGLVVQLRNGAVEA